MLFSLSLSFPSSFRFHFLRGMAMAEDPKPAFCLSFPFSKFTLYSLSPLPSYRTLTRNSESESYTQSQMKWKCFREYRIWTWFHGKLCKQIYYA
jgi:hypothetical protein